MVVEVWQLRLPFGPHGLVSVTALTCSVNGQPRPWQSMTTLAPTGAPYTAR